MFHMISIDEFLTIFLWDLHLIQYILVRNRKKIQPKTNQKQNLKHKNNKMESRKLTLFSNKVLLFAIVDFSFLLFVLSAFNCLLLCNRIHDCENMIVSYSVKFD